jgi:hypothetical protein
MMFLPNVSSIGLFPFGLCNLVHNSASSRSKANRAVWISNSRAMISGFDNAMVLIGEQEN